MGEAGSARPSSNSWVEAVATSAGLGGLAGTLAGVVWGGIGGRVAMRVLFVTSDDRLKGVTSDDGFEIGTISGATIFLLIATAFLGAIMGLVYGLARMVLVGPTWLIAIGVGIAAAAGGGASIVHTDGVDFRLLGPLWLAVGMFVLIPGLWGVTVVALAERLMRPGVVFATPPALINSKRWGATGWLVIGAIAVAGVIDLVNDITTLN
jgi:hypothetical protein